MRAALLMLILLSFCCHREVKKEERVEVDTHQETVLDTEKEVVETKEQAASRVTTTTTTEVYQPIVDARPAGASTPLAPTNAGDARVPTQHASVLIRKTTTVRVEDKGPVVSEKKSNTDAVKEETKAAVVKAEEKKVTETTSGPGFKFYLFLLIAIAVVVIGGYIYLTMFRRTL